MCGPSLTETSLCGVYLYCLSTHNEDSALLLLDENMESPFFESLIYVSLHRWGQNPLLGKIPKFPFTTDPQVHGPGIFRQNIFSIHFAGHGQQNY